ncbi:MAG: hypothetical protein M3525_16345, partial [Acidobacteriota bacterium]|nr:hypothetical protein [Acidobacteriota bacterium]
MHLFNRSRSAALWLIIIFGVTFAQAQNSLNDIDNLTNNTEKKSVSAVSSSDFLTDKNKIAFGKNNKTSKNFFPASDATETVGEYKKQNKTSNRELGFYAGSFTFHRDLKGPSQKAPVVLVGVRYAWTTKNNP